MEIWKNFKITLQNKKKWMYSVIVFYRIIRSKQTFARQKC